MMRVAEETNKVNDDVHEMLSVFINVCRNKMVDLGVSSTIATTAIMEAITEMQKVGEHEL